MSDTTGTQGADPTGNELLASAYLDSEVTADERARVESSPELLAEVERLRQVRAVLGATTEPPPISVREAHLAAALDVWDRMPESERAGEVTPSAGMDAAAAAAISTPSATSLDTRRARRSGGGRSGGGSTKWLLGAAAGLAVLAGAGIVLQGLGSDDDESDAFDASEAEAPAEEAASEDEIVADMAASEFVGDEVESAPGEFNADDVEADDGRFDEAAADEPAEEPAEDVASMEIAAEEPPADDAEAEAGTVDESSDPAEDPSPPEVGQFPLETSQDLADFGAAAAYAPVDPNAPAEEIEPTFNTCDVEFAGLFEFDTFAGPALYQGAPVIVGVDISADPPSVIAYSEECEFVASAPLPSQEVYEQRLLDDPDAG